MDYTYKCTIKPKDGKVANIQTPNHFTVKISTYKCLNSLLNDEEKVEDNNYLVNISTADASIRIYPVGKSNPSLIGTARHVFNYNLHSMAIQKKSKFKEKSFIVMSSFVFPI